MTKRKTGLAIGAAACIRVLCAAGTCNGVTKEDSVRLTTTSTPTITTAPISAEPYRGQTRGEYIYVNGFGWLFNEGGGGYGETNYDMYCNVNTIGYFG